MPASAPSGMCLAAVLTLACTSAPSPRPLPPVRDTPQAPPAELGVPSAPLDPPPADASATPTASASPAPIAAPDPGPRVHITLEPPYKLNERPVPKTRKEYQDDVLERRRWNDGGRGTLIREPPALEGHPLPRVIIDVTRVRGPHRQDEVQRELRRSMWIKVVECYRLGAYLNQKLRGKAAIHFQLSAKGKVTQARLTATTLADQQVAACLPIELKALALPKARSSSTATAEIQIGPGDDPMPPPPSAIAAGSGSLVADAILPVLTQALPELEACYRKSLEYAPELWGRIAIRLHVTRTGRVDEAFQVESRFPDDVMLRCVLKQAGTLVFPAPAGGDLRIVAPVRFSTELAVQTGVQAPAPQGESPP